MENSPIGDRQQTQSDATSLLDLQPKQLKIGQVSLKSFELFSELVIMNEMCFSDCLGSSP